MTFARTIVTMMQRAGFVPACCVFVLSSLLSPAQSTQATPPVPARDSAFAERTIEVADSVPDPWRTLGALTTEPTERVFDLGKSDRRMVQYRSLDELLIRSTPYQPLSHGGNAQHNAISVVGGTNADLGLSINGRTLVDPWSGAMAMAQLPPEMAERVEVLTGVHAIGLASSLTLSAANVQEVIHSTPTPWVALWYAQGGGEVLAADVELSQNVAPGMNVTLGVRRSGALGRYLSTGFDIWNVRAGVRWTLADLTHLNVSYQLASLNTELWGGLRTIIPLDQLTERTSPPVFASLQDESRRHDLTATLVHAFDADTTHSITAQVYGTATSMLRLRDTTMSVGPEDPAGAVTFHGAHTGMLLRSDHRLGFGRFRLGAGIDLMDVNATPYTSATTDLRPQVFAHARVPVGAALTFLASGRLTVAEGNVLAGAGAGVEWTPSAGSSVLADVSTAQRPPSAAEGLELRPERHILGTISWHLRQGAVQGMLQGFYRATSDALSTTSDRDSLQLIRTTTTINSGSRSVFGVVAQARWEHTWFDIRPMVRLHLEPKANGQDRFPTLGGELSAAGVYRVAL